MTLPAKTPGTAASGDAPQLNLSSVYQPAMGFAWRREEFGGILYWYEGVAPDPHVSFVDSPFLVELLDLVPQAPLGDVLQQVQEHFALPESQMARVMSFLRSLIEQGALVSKP